LQAQHGIAHAALRILYEFYSVAAQIPVPYSRLRGWLPLFSLTLQRGWMQL